MKALLSVLLLAASLIAGAAELEKVVLDKPPAKPACAQIDPANKEKLAQSGCCAWHDGVCGCSGGAVRCCDGGLSPSCHCLKEDEPHPERPRG